MPDPDPDAPASLDKLFVVNPAVALSLTAAMVVVYVGFILLIAFDKPLAGSLVGGVPGLSLGIFLGVLVILAAWVLTAVYVTWANRNDNSSEQTKGTSAP